MGDERINERGVGAPFGDPHQVVAERGSRVGADVDGRGFRIGEVGSEAADVVEVVIREAEGATGEEGVATAGFLRGLFEDENAGAVLGGGEGGAHGGVPGAGDDYVVAVSH